MPWLGSYDGKNLTFQLWGEDVNFHRRSVYDGQTFLAGRAVLLRGSASDIEDGNLQGQSLRWTLDGQVSGTGRERVIAGLAPGTYDVGLIARDSSGQEQTVSAVMNVAPLEVPLGDRTPALDGRCDDLAYETGQALQLAPYPDGAQATVHLLRRGDNLWACFSGLERGFADLEALVAALQQEIDDSNAEEPGGDQVDQSRQ